MLVEKVETFSHPIISTIALATPEQIAYTSSEVKHYTATASISSTSEFPIPYEYQELINTILNKKFRIEIKYPGDAAAFEFAVLVPQEYSNAGKPHWDTYHEDRRSKVILNAYGANGVREWVTQIYENFPPETKSRITYDRSQP